MLSLLSGETHLWVMPQRRKLSDLSRSDTSHFISHHSKLKPNTTLSKKITFRSSLFISLPSRACTSAQSECVRLSVCVRGCFDFARRASWMVDLAWREVRRACGLTSGLHVERWHGWMISAEGHALLKLGLGRVSTWETACVLFPTDGSAPATAGKRLKTERKMRGTVCGFSPLLLLSSWLLLFIYSSPQPGDQNVANLVFICPKTVVWYWIRQSFRATLARSSTVVKCAAIKEIIPLVLITALWNGFFNS